MFGLADCNNFFVSCERTRNRSLIGRPVVVLSNNDGCVVARSNEAKSIGIKMGQPAFQIKDRIRSGEVIALSGDHLFYRELSLKVHAIFRRYAPASIDYSIDEAFLDMVGVPDVHLRRIGEEIHSVCLQELGLPVTIGFAPTKTLAKIVTEKCKKCGRRVGVLTDPAKMTGILKSMPIGDLWGIGRRLTKKLYVKGIHTVGDFASRDQHWVRGFLGITGERSWLELHGISCIELEFVDTSLQDSISESRTFPEDTDDFDYLRARIAIYAADCATKLRKMQGICKRVGVYMSTNPFRADLPRRTFSLENVLDDWTDDTLVLVNRTVGMLEQIWPAIPMKRAGVWLSDIRPKSDRLPDLFQPTLPDHSSLMRTIDNINNIVGLPSIKLAAQMVSRKPGHNDGYSSSFQAPKQ